MSQRQGEDRIDSGIIQGQSTVSLPTETQLSALAERPPYVVGVGASAGGLEALEKLFHHMPPDTNLAFVVVQHLSPDFRSLMDELLARHTRIAIHRVENGMAVQANAIYLIPPKKEMIISAGKLLLTDKDPTQGLALPIDIFFRSLAQELGPRSAGIVLSGTGSDGSRGIRAIHEAGGLVIVQDEETAKFDGMPKSALETGAVDLVLPPTAMPEALLQWGGKSDLPVETDGPPPVPVTADAMNAVFKLLRSEYGIDFSHYKPSTVTRRIERRLMLNQCFDLPQYVEQLARDPGELISLYRDLLIGVTKFFRNRDAFDRLGAELIPQLLARVRPEEELRVWVAGCATGEEAYSLAILIHEATEAVARPVNVKIFATDVHRASLDFASAGVYPELSLSEVAQPRLDRYFMKGNGGYQVSQDLRKMIVFAPHNILRDAPFTRLDLVTCRNLLIYFQPHAQKKALSLFHFALKAGGILFLGPSESPSELADEFDVLDEHWKIYRKRRDVRLPHDLRLPLSMGSLHARAGEPQVAGAAALPDHRLLRAYDALMEDHVPPSLLVNERREVVHAFGGAGKWLVSRDGRPSSDVLEMVHRDLRAPLTGALQRVAKEAVPVVYRGIIVRHGEGEQQLKLIVKPLPGRGGDAPYMLVLLEPMTPASVPAVSPQEIDLGQVSQEQLLSMETELRYTKENLQATIEELETSNEELQATNEELVASNEELQSTNEELHSVNEELYTVNVEYQRKIVELTELTDDMDNLLRSTDIGAIFLDGDLCIRKFTPRIAETFSILPRDVDRRIDSFAHNIAHQGLIDDVVHVLKTGSRFEKEVRDRQGGWYLLRILPYSSRGTIEGVVLTLIDVSLLKRAEKDLRLMSKVFMDGEEPIVIEDLSGRVIDLNTEAERAYGWRREELLGRDMAILWPERLRDLSRSLRQRCRNQEHIRDYESLRRDKAGNERPILLTMSLLSDEAGEAMAIATFAKDISGRKKAEEELARYAGQLEQTNRDLRENMARRRKAEEDAREAVRRRDHFLAMLSHELRNPLGAILNAAHLLDRNGEDAATRQGASAVIQRQARQMSRLLEDLLDVSRVTQNKIEMRKQTVDLTATVSEAVDVIRPVAEARGQDFTVEVKDSPLCVHGDPSRLQQIQVNLLTNAVKYTPRGGSIRLEVGRDGANAVIRVKDTGQGIAADMIDSIFDLFVQCGNTLDRSDGGMGVGLTLVRTLVEMHGGGISASSPGLGQGSVFEARIPLSAEHAIRAPAPSVKPALPVAGKQVLIVEDNPDSREMLRELLELDGHEVAVAEDGLRGLEALGRQCYEIALIDIGLPGLDGYQIVRQFHAGNPQRKPYLVALTGYGQASDRKAVLEAGFDEHLVKPLKPEELARVLAMDASPPPRAAESA